MNNYNKTLFAAGDLSQATLTSDDCDLENVKGFSIQASFTGGATGTISIQASCDVKKEMPGNVIVNWTEVVAYGLTAPGSIMHNVDTANYRNVRLVYTRTAGAGTLVAKINAKYN